MEAEERELPAKELFSLNDREVEEIGQSMKLYQNVLSHFNCDDMSYSPVDIIFHSPQYSGRTQIQPNTMKERDFKQFCKRLNAEVLDGPYPSMANSLEIKLKDIGGEIPTLEAISNHLGADVVVLNNDFNNPITSQLPRSIRLMVTFARGFNDFTMFAGLVYPGCF